MDCQLLVDGHSPMDQLIALSGRDQSKHQVPVKLFRRSDATYSSTFWQFVSELSDSTALPTKLRSSVSCDDDAICDTKQMQCFTELTKREIDRSESFLIPNSLF